MPSIGPDPIQVAVGVITRSNGDVLIALRPNDKHLGGVWEFPGGKVEDGESTLVALSRELQEEIGITVRRARPLIEIRYSYHEMAVHLDVWEVDDFAGEAEGREGQLTRWVNRQELCQYEFPAANRPIVNALLLPSTIAVTGDFHSLADFSFRVRRAIARGADAIYVRLASHITDPTRHCEAAERVCTDYGIPILTNRELMSCFREQVALHLRSWELPTFSRGGGYTWVGASCHSPAEIAMAVSLGVDYVFLSPIRQTRTHPLSQPLGLDRFRQWVADASVPVYGLGGLSVADLDLVRELRGQGIAAIRSFWD